METETSPTAPERASTRDRRALQRHLSAAVEGEDIIAMQAALAAGARVDGGGGVPPLLAAAILGVQRPDGRWLTLLQRLVAAGADPNQAAGARGETALHRLLGAVRPWRTTLQPVVQALVDLGADLARPDAAGAPPLHAAVRSGHVDRVFAALAAGASADQPDRAGLRPLGALLTAAVADPAFPWAAPLDALLAAGARLERAGGTDISALHLLLALPAPRPDLLDFVLARGCPVDARDRRGRTPLHCAVEARRLDAVSLLLHAGADPNLVDRLGRSPMDLLAGRPAEGDDMHARIRALLRTSGARPALARQPGGSEARELLEALWTDAEAAGGLAAELRLVGLIAQGALDPAHGLPLLDGAPPLHAAVEANLLRAVEALLAAGHDPTWRDRGGQTALHRAARRGRLESLVRLLKAGAPPDLADDIGHTPLMAAAAAGDARCAAELLNAGADPHARSYDGRSASKHAAGELAPGIRALLSGGQVADQDRAVLVVGPRPGHAGGPASAFLARLSAPTDRWAITASRAPQDRVTDCLARSGARELGRDVGAVALRPGPDAVFVLSFRESTWTWVVRAINGRGTAHRTAAQHDFGLLRGLGADACYFAGDDRIAAVLDRGPRGQDVWSQERQTQALAARRGGVTAPGASLRLPASVREDLDGWFTRHGLWLPAMERIEDRGRAQLRLHLAERGRLARVDVLWGWPG